MAQAIEMTLLVDEQIGDAADIRVMADIANATTGLRMWTCRRGPA
jgi:hypothetical protein